MMNLKFLGAVGTVTGSKTLVDWRDKSFLVDCGMFQGLKELRLKNRDPILPLGRSAEDLDAVFLTHAHLDHSGAIPLLWKQGFRGPVYCTEDTRSLAEIILKDSARLQEEDADFANQEGFTKHSPALPLYTTQDVERCLSLFKVIPFQKAFAPWNEMKVQFYRAGHILGSSFIHFKTKDHSIVFSGDIGREQPLILSPKDPIPSCQHLILESTYGAKLHSKGSRIDQLEHIINATISRGGTLLVPSFAVGRTQDFLYLLTVLKNKRKLPSVPVYLDTPMGKAATEILFRTEETLKISRKMKEDMRNLPHVVASGRESLEIAEQRKPSIIIAGSGMITGGRILNHLKTRIQNAKHTLLLVGYQAEGTRGHQMWNKVPEIKFFGQLFPVKIQIEMIDSLSAHADQAEILKWIQSGPRRPKKIFLNHGERSSLECLRVKIESTLKIQTQIAQDGQEYDLTL